MEEGITMTPNVQATVLSPAETGMMMPTAPETGEVVANEFSDGISATSNADADMLLQIATREGFDEAFRWLSADDIDEIDPGFEETVEQTDVDTLDEENEGKKEIVVAENTDILERNKALEEENKELKAKVKKEEDNLRTVLETMQLMILVLALEREAGEEEKSVWETLVSLIGGMLQAIVMPDDENPINTVGKSKNVSVINKPKKKLTTEELREKVEELRAKMGLENVAMAA